MAITTIGGSINSTAVIPNLDYKYGPYTSTQEAYDALGPEGADKLVIGLTVGIIQNGEITEYWFKEGTTLADLVLKVSGSEDVDYSQLSNKPSINNVILNGNKTSSDLDLYTKPATGIPSTDLSSAVQTSLGKADISVSNTVDDLVNYYLKTETYTQTEVNNLIGAINQFHFEVYPDLASVTDPSSNVLYLIGPDQTVAGSDKYEEYVYANSNFVKIGDTSIDLSGYVTVSDLNTALTAYTTTTDLQTYYAQKDGEYNELHSGYTKWIEGNNSITDPDALFTYRPSHNNFITQYGIVEAIKGNSVVVNQLLKNPNFSTNSDWTTSGGGLTISDNVLTLTKSATGAAIQTCTLIKNHKYLLLVNGKITDPTAGFVAILSTATPSSYYGTINLTTSASLHKTIFTFNREDETCYVQLRINNPTVETTIITYYINLIDLTLMGIDNLTTVAEVEAWLVSNIGLRDYYPYSDGIIINSKIQGLKTIGFNRFNIINNTAKLPVATNGNLTNGTQCYQITGSYTALEDEDGNAITPNSAGFFNISRAQTITISGGNATTCVHLTWSGDKNGEYEEYWTETKEFDVTKIYGQLNGAGNYVQVYPSGMRSAGSVHDTLTANEAVVKIGSLDLGSLTWTNTEYNNIFYSSELEGFGVDHTGIPNIITAYYTTVRIVTATTIQDLEDMCITSRNTFNRLYIKNSNYENAPTAGNNWLNGVMLNYELATPLTYANLVYRDNGTDTPLVLPFNYRVDDYGSEEQVMPTPIDDEVTSCAAYLDLEYDIVSGIDFIKNTDDKLGDLDYRASRAEDRLDVVYSEIDDLKIPLQSSMPAGGMLPNVVYNLGTLGSNTTFTLATPTDNTVLNHYYWTFDIGSTVPTLTWPTGIIWAGDNLSPIIEANKHYEVSVINNIGTYIYSVIS